MRFALIPFERNIFLNEISRLFYEWADAGASHSIDSDLNTHGCCRDSLRPCSCIKHRKDGFQFWSENECHFRSRMVFPFEKISLCSWTSALGFVYLGLKEWQRCRIVGSFRCPISISLMDDCWDKFKPIRL